MQRQTILSPYAVSTFMAAGLLAVALPSRAAEPAVSSVASP